MVQVELSAQAARQLDDLTEPILSRIQSILERLEHWPEVSGAKPLRHELQGHFRIRTGSWRIVFRLEGPLLIVKQIDKRRDVYGR
jgi:mRNA-degrading endonuclease RelE of RelBE toxin-antitoxin system